MEIINYLFYRLYKYYKGSNPIFTASLYITMFQLFIVYFIVMTINAFFYRKGMIMKEVIRLLDIELHDLKTIVFLIYIIVHYANYKYYRKRIKSIENKYQNSPYNKTFKLWMLYFVAIFLFFVPMLFFKIFK